MSKIKIKNFGPIKEGYVEDDGFLDIKKVTIFIGNQGSGKSTVAKLISTMMWLEKALNRGDVNKLSKEKIDSLFKFQGVEEYFSKNQVTNLEYLGDQFSIEYRSSKKYPDIKRLSSQKYIVPKIMYIPAERNTLSSIGNMFGVTGMPDHLFTFYEEFRKAQKELKGESLELPINNYVYQYEEENNTSYVIGAGYKINLPHASSGVQSLIPLYIVSQNLSCQVNQADDILRKNLRSESILSMNDELAALEWDNTISEAEKTKLRIEIRSKYLPKCFINIVEEPEQNLYPSSQRHILNSLLEFNNQSEGNKLIMTTHSPYIINYLSLAIYAGSLKDKIHSKELMDKLHAIVPLQSTIQASDVAIYQLDERDGTIRKLPSFEGIPSDQNYLNQSLAEGNELFDSLLEIEQEL